MPTAVSANERIELCFLEPPGGLFFFLCRDSSNLEPSLEVVTGGDHCPCAHLTFVTMSNKLTVYPHSEEGPDLLSTLVRKPLITQ